MTRAPRSFDVDTPSPKPTAEVRRPRPLDLPPAFEPAPDEAAQRVEATPADELAALEVPPTTRAERRFSFAKLLAAGLALLVTLALGIAVDELIDDLFARADWLGWVAIGLTLLVLFAILGMVVREVTGLWRLGRIGDLRERADNARHASPKAARAVVRSLVALTGERPETARGRRRLAELDGDVMDAADLVDLAERNLMGPLDNKARALVLGSAKRVSVVTAVSPRALIDIAFVLAENLRLIRQMADLYGGRPGTLGFLSLAKRVVSHLAVTGSIAVGDGLLQQVVGHGVAARLSQRLGEGVVNGLLTARVGIAAMDVCRPMSFHAITRPGVSDFVADLTRLGHKAAREGDSPVERPSP